MKPISPKVHGVLDYSVSILLIGLPALLEIPYSHIEAIVPVVAGSLTILYSLFTDYTFGVIKVLPFRTHLTIDTIANIIFVASPWIFGFSDRIFLPYVIIGLADLIIIALTNATHLNSQRVTQMRTEL